MINLPPTRFIDDFFYLDLSDMHYPMIVIYYNTSDFPDHYIARMFDLRYAQALPTDIAVIRETLKEIREVIPSTFKRRNRDSKDDKNIVELWVL